MSKLLGWMLAGLLLAAPVQAEQDDPRLTPVVLAYRKARPAVVNISAKSIARVGLKLFRGDPFEDVFPMPLFRGVPVQSVGSGFIVHPAGYIVTNAHVVRRAQQITVTLRKDEEFPARVISADPIHDLAVLKIEAPADVKLQHLPLGHSDDLMVGETVIAIGNPFGYANTVTTGVVSAIDRTLTFRGGVKYEGLIQIDAPVNPGNSGGPLLNIKGELIGINTAIRADAQNIGFAVPVDLLAEEFAGLLDFERINRVVFGASLRHRRGRLHDELYVTELRPGSPAAEKLQKGDRVLAINDLPMQQITDFTCAMLAVKPGSQFALKCLRDGKELTATFALAAKPKPDGRALAEKLFGMTLRLLTPELAREQGLSIDRGLLVVGLEPNGSAQHLGIQLMDVVFQLDRFYVTELDDLGMVLEDVQPDDRIKIGILRGNITAWSQIRAGALKAQPRTPE